MTSAALNAVEPPLFSWAALCLSRTAAHCLTPDVPLFPAAEEQVSAWHPSFQAPDDVPAWSPALLLDKEASCSAHLHETMHSPTAAEMPSSVPLTLCHMQACHAPAGKLNAALDSCALSAAAEKLDAARVKTMVDDIWEARLQSGDPLENLLHKTEVGALEVHIVEGNGRGNKGTMGGAFSSAQIGDLCRARNLQGPTAQSRVWVACKSAVVHCGSGVLLPQSRDTREHLWRQHRCACLISSCLHCHQCPGQRALVSLPSGYCAICWSSY